VIGDSIIKYVEGTKLVVQVRRGATISSLQQDIVKGKVRLTGCSTVVLHVGTNDVANGVDEATMIKKYKELVKVAKVYSEEGTELVFSAIIPRYGDVQSDGTVRRVNQGLMSWYNRTGGLFLRTFSIFRKSNKIVPEMYARDGVHLSRVGSRCLTEYFKSHTSPGYLKTLRKALLARSGRGQQ